MKNTSDSPDIALFPLNYSVIVAQSNFEPFGRLGVWALSSEPPLQFVNSSLQP